MNEPKRPLSMSWQNHADEEGITDAAALRKGLVAADGFVVLRYAADGEKMGISAQSVGGAGNVALEAGALFDGWVSFTAYVAKQAREAGDVRASNFLTQVLHLMQLDETLNPLSPPSQTSERAPAVPPSREGEGPGSTG